MEMLHSPDWYIVYTKLCREKKVADHFSQKNIKNYCPMKRAKPIYSDLFKSTYEPLFTSYVFVYVAPAEHPRIKKIHEVISLVHWLGKPAVIRNAEIDAIKKFLSLYNDVILEKIPVCTNNTISVMHNLLTQEEGMVPEVMNRFVKVQLPSLGYVLKASREPTTTIDTLHSENYQQSPVTKFAS
jgi:transcription antitermination factor NusG